MISVNENCIGCGICEGIAGSLFKVEGVSKVIKQPETEQEYKEAKDAMAACPVAAIQEESETKMAA